jgi:ATP-dependent protease ClpP protease subunit
MRIVLIYFCFIIFSGGAEPANVYTSTESSPKSTDLHITGHIDSSDVNKVRKYLNSTRIAKVLLDSNGGDLDAALKIGDLIYNASYEVKATTKDGRPISWRYSPVVEVFESVKYQAHCASACVFILASAKTRFIFCILDCERIMIHNPYAVNTASSYNDIKNRTESYKMRAIHQFTRVGVSEKLWDLMVRTPSEEPRALSKYEIEDLGLHGSDPSYDDYMNGNFARLYGYTKSDYLERKALANSCRHDTNDYIGCNKKYGLALP